MSLSLEKKAARLLLRLSMMKYFFGSVSTYLYHTHFSTRTFKFQGVYHVFDVLELIYLKPSHVEY